MREPQGAERSFINEGQRWGKRVSLCRTWPAAHRGSFILGACLHNSVGLTPLPGGDTCRLVLSLLIVPEEERGQGGRGREDLRQWWGSMTSLIKCRHSEKCFPLVAAIYFFFFLVLICTPWQGFVKGNNEPLYHPPPRIVVAPVRRR